MYITFETFFVIFPCVRRGEHRRLFAFSSGRSDRRASLLPQRKNGKKRNYYVTLDVIQNKQSSISFYVILVEKHTFSDAAFFHSCSLLSGSRSTGPQGEDSGGLFIYYVLPNIRTQRLLHAR